MLSRRLLLADGRVPGAVPRMLSLQVTSSPPAAPASRAYVEGSDRAVTSAAKCVLLLCSAKRSDGDGDGAACSRAAGQRGRTPAAAAGWRKRKGDRRASGDRGGGRG
jgi:hypothetical protein